MFHGKSHFCCRYFPYQKNISQRKAHVLPDLHFWLVEITQKWDDVRLEPGIRSGQRSTSPVFDGLGTKNNRSIGNIGPGMARLLLEELAISMSNKKSKSHQTWVTCATINCWISQISRSHNKQ